MIPPNFVHKLQMNMILMMMTCLTSHLVVVKIYFVSKCLWVFVFEISHISNSSLIHINVVSKSCCNWHFHVTKMITFLIQNSLVHLNPLGAPKRLWCLGCSTLWRFNIVILIMYWFIDVLHPCLLIIFNPNICHKKMVVECQL